jgi:hypothetical protein
MTYKCSKYPSGCNCHSMSYSSGKVVGQCFKCGAPAIPETAKEQADTADDELGRLLSLRKAVEAQWASAKMENVPLARLKEALFWKGEAAFKEMTPEQKEFLGP